MKECDWKRKEVSFIICVQRSATPGSQFTYCRTVIFQKHAIFGIWLIWVFGKVYFSEFADVEFLPILIRVNSAERLTHWFSVQAPNFRSWCLLQNSTAMHYVFPCYLLLVQACAVVP